MGGTRTSTRRVVALLAAALLPMALVVDATPAAAAGPAPTVTLDVSPQPAAVNQLVTYTGRVTNAGDQPAPHATMIWKLRDFTPDDDGVVHLNPNQCVAEGQFFDAIGLYHRIVCPVGVLGVGQQASSTLTVHYNEPGRRSTDFVGRFTADGGARWEAQASNELVVTAQPAPPASPLDALVKAVLGLLGLG